MSPASLATVPGSHWTGEGLGRIHTWARPPHSQNHSEQPLRLFWALWEAASGGKKKAIFCFWLCPEVGTFKNQPLYSDLLAPKSPGEQGMETGHKDRPS